MTTRDLPAYQYDCSAGHELAASQSLDACPVVVKGSTCAGTLTRFGRGSRTERQAS